MNQMSSEFPVTQENKEAALTFATPSLGRKRVAFVPLFRARAAPPDQIPPDWENVILRRVVYDPRREANGADRSLRGWLRAVSSGLADIDPVVLPMQTIDKQVVEADELEGTLGPRLREQGMDAAVLVMLGGRESGTNSGFWSRVVMVESNGVWLMELIHGLTGFKDLYHFDNDADPGERSIDTFDEMSASSQTHPTAFTKNEFGWLNTAAIRLHAGASVNYELQHISLAQPPVAGRVAAVRIGDSFPYVLIEARKKTDQFEAGMPSTRDVQERGIASEGVIAYRVQTRNPTVQAREGNKKPLYLMTLTALQPGQSAALDNGVTLTVTSALPDGFGIRIDDAGQHLIDRTATTRARTAAGPPCALVLNGPGIENIAYRDTAGHMNEIWRDPRGQGTTDLTANAGAPAAQGNPFTYFDPADNQVVLVFRGTDNQVRTLYWMFGAVGHDNLTGAINAPKTAGDPAGWFSAHDAFHHVVYRSGDGHLHELWWQGQGGVGHGDLTAQANAVSAAGDPWPYYDPVRSTNIVVFRGTDRHIRSLYWAPDGAVGQDDLSGFAGTPAAAGDPFAWFTPAEDTHRIVYRAANGHLYELFWPNVAPVQGRDLTALSGAPPAIGNVSGGYNPSDNTQHVIFHSANGRMHELWHFLGETAVHHVDLTAAYGGPPAVDRPVYYASMRAPNQHVAYRGTNGHIYELLW
ncbi:MAG: hypothetical protein WKF97_18950 [Chitinophagaceae bacterium]